MPWRTEEEPDDEARLDPRQAYAVCSVAVDIQIGQVADLPDVLVSAFLRR